MTATAAPARAAFPETVWTNAVLRGLDARARAELEAAGRLRTLAAGERVYDAGDTADAVLVVVSGRFVLAGVRRGDTEGGAVRRVTRGEMLGEEAMVVAFGVRPMEARCEEAGVVAELPATVLRRALGRGGASEHVSRIERVLRRAATRDLFRATGFTRALPEADLDVLLDAAGHVHVGRGEHLYREGDEAENAYVVADGLLQAQTDDEGTPRIEGYFARGDVLGDEELEDRSRRRVAVVASGPSWVVGIPRDVFVGIARRQRDALEGPRRMRVSALPVLPSGHATTAHVFRDLYRMRVASSLLVIDQDACVRCGHCAWSCASTHDDGISRLVRRGDKVVVRNEQDAAPLLVPNSCQHCKNPSCMIDCPTGAIGRDARGEVFIREDLCTGCGSCAKGCPWDNIQIAPRGKASPRSSKSAYPDVAVKCDLCSGAAARPACVAACPTQAIARIDPNAALVELQRAPRLAATRLATPAAPALLPSRAPAWPSVVAAALASAGLAAARLPAWTSGVVAGVLLVLLVAYAGVKRAPRVVARLPRVSGLARHLYVAHVALGIAVLGAVVAHTHGRVTRDVAGALTLALALTVTSGVAIAAAYALVPRRLSRLERKSVLPEELSDRRRVLGEQLFAQLSGRSDVVKMQYARVLAPYVRARIGALALVLSGRSLADEEARLARMAGEPSPELSRLVRLVVEHRAVGAVGLLTGMLRAFVPVHLAATATSIVLLVAHVLSVVLRARGR